VLADTRRLADCFASIDYFEKRGLAFVVAINCFDGAHRYDPAEVRAALDLGPGVPVVACDARQPESAKDVLISLVQLILDRTPDEGYGIRAAPAAPPLL
jgi:signal recognition particle receptor subunit beta